MAPAVKKTEKPNMKNKFQKPENTKKTFARLLSYLGRSKAMLAVVFVFVLFSSLAGVIGTSFIKTVTDDVLPTIIASGGRDLAPLVNVLIKLAVIYGLGIVSTYCYSRIMLQVAQKTLNTIRKDLFNHMQELPIKFFDSHTHGELMNSDTQGAHVK